MDKYDIIFIVSCMQQGGLTQLFRRQSVGIPTDYISKNKAIYVGDAVGEMRVTGCTYSIPDEAFIVKLGPNLRDNGSTVNMLTSNGWSIIKQGTIEANLSQLSR